MLPVIIVMIVGILCIVISVVAMGKENSALQDENTEFNHITEEYELNEEEIAVLQRRVSEKISADVEDVLYNADQSLSTMSNEKMMALGDYAVTVCDEIEKNHKEVMFLYSMLSDKEKELKALVADADVKMTELKALAADADARTTELKKLSDLAIETYAVDEPELEAAEELEETEEKETLEGLEEAEAQEDNTNDIILEMKRNGMSIMEIARELGLGVGEVKLVVDLYQGDTK